MPMERARGPRYRRLGAWLKFGDRERELFGGERRTTNNRMELTAVIRALETLTRPCEVDVHVDSSYVQKASASGFTAGNGIAGARRTKSPSRTWICGWRWTASSTS